MYFVMALVEMLLNIVVILFLLRVIFGFKQASEDKFWMQALIELLADEHITARERIERRGEFTEEIYGMIYTTGDMIEYQYWRYRVSRKEVVLIRFHRLGIKLFFENDNLTTLVKEGHGPVMIDGRISNAAKNLLGIVAREVQLASQIRSSIP